MIEADPGASDSVTTVLGTAGVSVQCFTSADSFFDLYVPGTATCLISAAQLPGGDVLDVQKKLAHMKSRLPVIILTGRGDIPLAVAAMKNGAIDFIEEPFDAERLLRSVKIGLYRGTNDRREAARVDLIKLQVASLTPRELEVFLLLLAGEGNKAMARSLGVSIRTLEVHRAHLMAKMEARSLADLVRVGMLAGIWRP